MAISFQYGWDYDVNHTSGRSQEEVQRIIEEIPRLTLSYDHSNGELGTAIKMGFDISVTKGIHDDSRGKHVTVYVKFTGRTWHLYLKEDEYRSRDSTFIWRVNEIR
jgi:hypothetical protein